MFIIVCVAQKDTIGSIPLRADKCGLRETLTFLYSTYNYRPLTKFGCLIHLSFMQVFTICASVITVTY